MHGNNEKINDSMCDFLNSIGLQAVQFKDMFRRRADRDLEASEIFNTIFKKVQVFLSILTPAEVAVKKLQTKYLYSTDTQKKSKLNFRTNVLIGTGMALALNRERIVVVEIGELGFYKDLTGIQKINLDNSPERRKELLEKLTAVGCDVNVASDDWLSVGDFSDAAQYKRRGSTSKIIYKVINSEVLLHKLALKNLSAKGINPSDSQKISLEKKDDYTNILSYKKPGTVTYLEPISKDKNIVDGEQKNLKQSSNAIAKNRFNEEVKYLEKMKQLQEQLKYLQDNKQNRKKIAEIKKQIESESYRYKMLQQLWSIEDLR